MWRATIVVFILLMMVSNSTAQEGLDSRAVLKQLEAYRAYGDVVRENKDRPYLRVQFGSTAIKPDDVATIVKVVQQSAIPVALNFNQIQSINDQAVTAIKGADKLIGISLGGTQITDESLKIIGALTNLEQVYLASEALTNDGLAHLANLTKLRKLSVYSKKITSDGYKHLAKMTLIEELNVGDVFKIDDTCLAAIKDMPNLKELRLARDLVTDAGMPNLKNLTGLKKLTVEGSKITAEGLKHLAGLKNLEELTIMSCPAAVKADGFQVVGELTALKELTVIYSGAIDAKGSAALKKLTNLKRLRFDSVTKDSLEGLRGTKNIEALELVYSFASDDSLAPLKEVSGLKSLNISNTQVGDAGLKHLANLTELRTLYAGNTKITDDGLVAFQPLSSLEYLSLSECKLNGSGLKHLASLTKLKDLSLSGNPIKDDALAPLHKMTNLTMLNLTGTKTNDEAVLGLKKSLPKTRVLDIAGDEVVVNPRIVERKPMGEDISKKEPDFKLKAADFFAEYKKGSQAAADKYKKKIIELTGEVAGLGTNISNEAYINLKVEGDFIGVMCVCRDPQPWVKVLPGQTVTIKGEWPEYSFSAAIINCSIVQAGPAKHFEFTAEQFAKEIGNSDGEEATKKFKDKYIVLTGKVVDKEFNSVGAGTIILETTGKPVVKCSFTAFDKNGVKALKVGQTVRIAGQYTFGFSKDEVSLYFSLLLPAK